MVFLLADPCTVHLSAAKDRRFRSCLCYGGENKSGSVVQPMNRTGGLGETRRDECARGITLLRREEAAFSAKFPGVVMIIRYDRRGGG